MSRILGIVVSVLLTLSGLKAQEIVLERDAGKSVFTNKRDVNHKSFGYIFGNYQVYPVNNSSKIEIEPFKSHNFSVGYKRLFRIFDWYSVAGSLCFMNDSYTIEQNGGKVFPTPKLHKSERVLTYNLTPEAFQRFLLKKDYKHLGVYLDIGFYGSVTIGSRHKMYDSDVDTALNGDSQVTKVKGLDYVSPYNYGLTMRLGFNRFAVVTKVRLSDWLKSSYGLGQPPAGSAGLELSLY